METIIFSYNRPAQLDLLLRSIKRFTDLDSLTVLYLNEPGFEYDQCIKEHPEVKFVYRTSNLKKHLLDTIKLAQDYGEKLVLFLCDDDIFINKVSTKNKQFRIFTDRTEILALSLRMSRTMNYCFDSDIKVDVPQFDSDYAWVWGYYPYDWGYPMSLSGHIFRTDEIKPLLEKFNYDNPTQLESQLAQAPLKNPLMLCFPSQKVVEAPINIVQNECFTNRTGDIDAQWLNDMYSKGNRIDLDFILKNKFVGCHQLIEVRWK